ncbi:MAG: hypothetical protein QGH20_09925 [Candidatus Latescibacteria bacterium]|jgi:hypothetical protein|nr:hypothetical protein [Candidatus Latescibacterota bacterium]
MTPRAATTILSIAISATVVWAQPPPIAVLELTGEEFRAAALRTLTDRHRVELHTTGINADIVIKDRYWHF